jgi:hypothetical protein
MMLCAVMTVSTLINNVLPGWHTGLLASVMLFIVIDRLYTFRQLKTLPPFSSEWAIAIGMQWVLILLVIRFLLSYANGLDSFEQTCCFYPWLYCGVVHPEFVGDLTCAFGLVCPPFCTFSMKSGWTGPGFARRIRPVEQEQCLRISAW